MFLICLVPSAFYQQQKTSAAMILPKWADGVQMCNYA